MVIPIIDAISKVVAVVVIPKITTRRSSSIRGDRSSGKSSSSTSIDSDNYDAW